MILMIYGGRIFYDVIFTCRSRVWLKNGQNSVRREVEVDSFD